MYPSDILNTIKETGGYTQTGVFSEGGRYIVGVEDLGIIPLSDTDTLLNRLRELQNEEFSWGAWVNDDKVYFDRIIATNSLFTATSIGKEFNQLAIFDSLEGVEIILDKVVA